MKQISALHIFWAIVTPQKGTVTKRDLKKASKEGFTSFGAGNKYMIRHSGNVDNLITMCRRIIGLKKKYTVTIITDKQFGNISWPDYNPLTVATSLQKERSFVI